MIFTGSYTEEVFICASGARSATFSPEIAIMLQALEILEQSLIFGV